MFARTSPGRFRGLAATALAAALLVGACGGSTGPSAATSAAPATAAPASDAPATSADPGATTAPGASAAVGYSGPPATIEYAIWGDPAEIGAQTAIAEAFMTANPAVTVKVSVSDWDAYWDKLQTGIAGGAAPDVFAMDGPLFPDYQSRDVLLDLKPFIDRDGYDLTQLADQGVADFTTPGGQFGLPRDLNTVVLYYNKTMFDAAGLPYPDESWDWAKLVEVGKKLTKDANGDGTPDQWGLYTETTDMENFYLSAIWQAGGDVLAPDGKSTVLGTDQAAAGVQFLQDLIWKDRIMADPAVFADTGDAFEQGLAAMESNGSWLVGTHTAAGIDFGVAPLPKGPAGRFTSVNPTGAVVYKGTKSPDAAWAFVKYLASPAAQEQLMALKASLPVNKSVLEGAYATSFDGAKVFADSLSYARLKPSFKGYNEFSTLLQAELDMNVFNAPNKTAKQALADVVPKLDALLAGQ
jgi:multiple sugar transport system substrate-binding protein